MRQFAFLGTTSTPPNGGTTVPTNGTAHEQDDGDDGEGSFLNQSMSSSIGSSSRVSSVNGTTSRQDEEFASKTTSMAVLELEPYEEEDVSERDSLIRETADWSEVMKDTSGRDNSKASWKGLIVRSRRRNGTANNSQQQRRPNVLLGLVRDRLGHHFSLRNFGILFVLCSLVLVILRFDVNKVHSLDDQEHDVIHKSHHHESSFAIHKINSTTIGATSKDGGNEIQWTLPKSNIGSAVTSISANNIVNRNGQYWHNPFVSPFASDLYAYSEQATSAGRQQVLFDQRKNAVVRKFGQWIPPSTLLAAAAAGNATDSTVPPVELVFPSFSKVEYKDGTDFPEHAWQTNQDYVQAFLQQAMLLVRRVQFAIWEEYGHTVLDTASVLDNHDELMKLTVPEEIKKLFGVLLVDDSNKSGQSVPMVQNGIAVDDKTHEPIKGVAHLNKAGWEGLVRKLLHAIMTEDEFYVTVVGKGHTYMANNFLKTQIQQFNYIMEPVFDNLGVTLISRNMGMDATTTISALGGADVYGEADILWYIPGDASTEEDAGTLDLLQRQSILSGERIPVILTPAPLTGKDVSKLWYGNIQPGIGICPLKQSSTNTAKACENVNCGGTSTSYFKSSRNCRVYDSFCWVERTDWNPNPSLGDAAQMLQVPHANGDYPNAAQHQFEGRKLALMVLQALEEALTRWQDQLNHGNTPLDQNMWHVGPAYRELRDSVRTLERLPGVAALPPPCESLLAGIDPMICHISMHVLTEWTPRVNPFRNRLSEHVVSEYENANEDMVQLYIGPDLLPLQWQAKDDEIDVHLVSIVTNQTTDVQHETGFDGPLFDDDSYQDGANDDFTLLRTRQLDHQQDRLSEKSVPDYISSATSTSTKIPFDRNYPSPPTRRTMSEFAEDKWTLFGAPLGFCDGSAQSTCNRKVGNVCLLANHNHYRAGMLGHGSSGWLHVNVPVTEGIILLRFDWSMKLDGESFGDRSLAQKGGDRLTELPKDFVFDYALGGIDKFKSLSRDEFLDFGIEIESDLIVYPVMIDKEMSVDKEEGGGSMLLSIRIQSEEGAAFRVLLTHIYYA